MRLMHPLADATVERRTVDAGGGLRLDLTLPDGDGPWPVALVVHGAVPAEMKVSMRKSEMYRGWGAALAASGVAGLVFDHTLGWPQLQLDRALAEVDQVLGWLAQAGPGLGLDLARFSAVLVSGGGVLAAELLAGERPLPIRAAALFSPLLGAPDDSFDPAVAARMDLAAAAPKVAAADAPLTIFRAGGDQPGLLALLDEAVAALLAADAWLELDNFPGAPHCYEVQLEHPHTRAAIERALRLAAGA